MVAGLYLVPEGSDTPGDSQSVGPEGKRAFHDLLQRHHGQVHRQATRLIPPGPPRGTLLVLGPARYPTAEEWKALHRWVTQGGALVFAARHPEPEVKLGPFGVEIDQVTPPAEALLRTLLRLKGGNEPEAEKDRSKPATSRLVTGTVRWYSRGRIARPVRPALDPLVLLGDHVQAASMTVGQGRLVVVASARPFTNHALAHDEGNGLLALRLVEAARAGGPVWFDESLNRSGTPRTLGLLTEPAFRPLTFQLLLAALLLAWWWSHRFGPIRAGADPPRRSIAEHAEALGFLHWRAGTAGRSLAAYLEFLRLEWRMPPPGSPSANEWLARLARKARREPAEVAQLLAEAVQSAGLPRLPRGRAAALVQGLARLKQDVDQHSRGDHGHP